MQFIPKSIIATLEQKVAIKARFDTSGTVRLEIIKAECALDQAFFISSKGVDFPRPQDA